MSDDVLSLREALERWCELSLVERIKSCEQRNTARDIDSCRRLQFTNRAFRLPIGSTSTKASDNLAAYRAAWNDLERDLRQRIETGQMFLRGVQLAPERRTEPEVIAGAWAADFRFDFSKETITVGKHRFSAIVCSLVPWVPEPKPAPEPPAPEPAPAAAPSPAPPIAETLTQLRPEDFPDLSDEMVLALLEEHARRVIANDSQLIAPGKVSLLSIIRGKMQYRAGRGELLPTITAEAEWLAAWIKERIKLHQVPAAGTISRVLANDYNQMANPRSTPAI